jgi:lipid A disaccharide synthetase
VIEQLDRPDRAALIDEYGRIHRMLRCDASQRAADAVLELVAGRRSVR